MESDPSQDGRQVGWLTGSAPTNYSFLTHRTTGLKTRPCMPTNCQKLFYHIHNNHKNIHLALHRWLMMYLYCCKQTHWDKAQPDRNATRRNWYDRNKSAPTAAYGKGSLSFSQHQRLAQMPFIPHVAMARAGSAASDIILTTSATGPEQQTYSNGNVKRDTNICSHIFNKSKAVLHQTTRPR